MKSLEARISALEQRRPAPNVVFVARYRPGGALVPLRDGQVYGRNVALLAEPCGTVDEWKQRFVGRPWTDLKAGMDLAESNLAKHFRQRDGNQTLARTNTR